jgi:guanylate kinase
MKKWHLYFIMGISGSGKWTLIENIRRQNLFSFHTPLSYKTREIRPNEVNGKDSYFVSKSEFYAAIERWEFLEYALVHETDYYGTKYEDVLDKGILLWMDTVKEIDINGLKKLRSERPDLDGHYSTIFLNIPLSALPSRIETRGVFMSDQELKRRLMSAQIEEEEIAAVCDYQIDATLPPEEVLRVFLQIVQQKKSVQ